MGEKLRTFQAVVVLVVKMTWAAVSIYAITVLYIISMRGMDLIEAFRHA